VILHYYEKGNQSDQVVLFVHGSASDATVWLNELNIVAARGYRCLAFDLRGHGETQNMEQPLEKVKLDIDTHIHDVKETLEYLGILRIEKQQEGDNSYAKDKLVLLNKEEKKKKIIIVTHSFGGIVAVNIAEQYPDLVEKLILVCVPPKLIFPVRDFLKFLLGKPLTFIQANLDFFAKTPLRARYKSSIMTNAHVLQEIYKHVRTWNSFRKVPRLKQQIYFAAGRFDLVAPAPLIYKLYEKTPHAAFELFKWSSHALMEDEPELFQKWLVKCITK
jgi:pimeloyl-ACP methyl ester carboxylesterase